MDTPKSVKRAIKKYSEEKCRDAYDLNSRVGEGANTIGGYFGWTTRQADAAINAGRWLVDPVAYARCHY